jgi:hypothetical protein
MGRSVLTEPAGCTSATCPTFPRKLQLNHLLTARFLSETKTQREHVAETWYQEERLTSKAQKLGKTDKAMIPTWSGPAAARPNVFLLNCIMNPSRNVCERLSNLRL